MSYKRFSARWKKLPITIRAAYIGGLFALLAVVLAWLLAPRSKHTPSGDEQRSPNEKAHRIVADYFGVGKSPDVLHDFSAVWCDLFSSGQEKEFYATYNYAQVDYLTVFTTRNQMPENLFHRHSKGGYALQGDHVTINGTPYFLCSTKVGSGGYLDLIIFQYDGVGKLKIVHKQQDLFQGRVWVISDRIFLDGGNRRYELALDPSEFRLTPYNERVEYIEGSANHVLAYHIEDSNLCMTFDGTPIQFTEDQDHYVSKHPIVLGADEQIIEDDNIIGTDPQQIRLLSTEGEFACKSGFFNTLVPLGVGTKELTLSFNYERWYRIKVIVKDKWED